MTTLSERPAPLPDRIQEDRTERAEAAGAVAEQVRGRAVLTAIGAVFFAIGWVIGAVVSILGYMWGALRFGYAQGRMVVPSPPRTPSQPRPASSGALPGHPG